MSALKTGATGRYVDADGNAFAVLVIGPHFEVKSPGNDKNGAALPPARVPVSGFVRVRLFDEYGFDKAAEIPESGFEPSSATTTGEG